MIDLEHLVERNDAGAQDRGRNGSAPTGTHLPSNLSQSVLPIESVLALLTITMHESSPLKTPRDRVFEVGRYEFVSDLSRFGRHMVQTVVAHEGHSPSWLSRISNASGNLTVSLPSIRTVNSLNSVACCPTELTGSVTFGARPAMLIAFSRAKNRPTCRCKRRRSTSWWCKKRVA